MATIEAQIRIRRDTAANFTSANPTLALGEIAYETDTRNLKVGDGATAWTALPYINPYRAGTAAAPTSNTVLGGGAGVALQSGAINNTLIGQGAGAAITTQGTITAIGTQAASSYSTGQDVTVIGYQAAAFGASGSQSVVIGSYAGRFYGPGNANVIIGDRSLDSNGAAAGSSVLIGANTAGGTTSAMLDVVGIGANALHLNAANDTVAIGSGALDANTTGANNTAVGRNALGANTTGSVNTAVGHGALAANTTGTRNIVVGGNAGAAITSSSYNVAMGYDALKSVTTTSGGNTAIGQEALGANTNSSAVGIGQNALVFCTDAFGTVAVGTDVGVFRGTGSDPLNGTCQYSILIGNDARVQNNGQSNQIVIGQAGRGNGSNTTTIGNSSTTGTYIPAGNLTLQGGALTANGGFIGTTIQRITGYGGLLDDIGFVANTGTISVASASGMAYCPANDRLYSVRTGGSVVAINPATNSVTATISVGSLPICMAYCPVNNSMYVTNYISDTVSVISCATNTVTATVNVGDQPRGIAYCPVNDTMYVCNQGDDDVSPIACSTNTKGTDIAVGDQPWELCYCPTNNTMYVCNSGDNDVSPIDCAAGTKGTDIAVGTGPWNAAYSRSNNRLYVANSTDNDITKINPATNTVDGADIAVGANIQWVGVNPKNNCVYAKVAGGNVDIIDIGMNAKVQAVTGAGSNAGGGAFCASNGRMYVSSQSSTIAVLT